MREPAPCFGMSEQRLYCVQRPDTNERLQHQGPGLGAKEAADASKAVHGPTPSKQRHARVSPSMPPTCIMLIFLPTCRKDSDWGRSLKVWPFSQRDQVQRLFKQRELYFGGKGDFLNQKILSYEFPETPWSVGTKGKNCLRGRKYRCCIFFAHKNGLLAYW